MKFYKRDRKSGFTLVELLVVLSMLMILAASITTSVASGEKRAKISRATAEAKEMTNAILAYSHFGPDYDLGKHKYNTWTPATKQSLRFIIGDEVVNGEKVPVLYNAAFNGDRMLDPWGRPYYVMIKEGSAFKDEAIARSGDLRSYVAFPNFNRRPADK